MIRYALICDNEHEFESWFPDSDAFDAQAKRGFIACPTCASAKVAKAIMAPRLATRHLTIEAAEPAAPEPAAPAPDQSLAMAPADRDVRTMLRALRDHLKANADDVGEKFPELARKMHYGETEQRSIYGKSSFADAKALHDEGIEVHPLPILPDDRN